jgi:hypothetical protein
VQFFLNVLQALAIIGSAWWASHTFGAQNIAQKDAIERELRKPFDDKKLQLYAEAARITANLAINEDATKDVTDRFWELYWGELPFVECKSVRTRMIAFCDKRFGERACGGQLFDKEPLNATIAAAKALALDASDEIQKRWKNPDCSDG